MPRDGATTEAGPQTSARLVDVFLTHTDDVVLLFAGDGSILWASPPARRVFGIEAAALVGRNGMEVIHPDDQGLAFEAFSTIPTLGDSVRAELRIIDSIGQVRWVEEVATNLLDEPEVRAVVVHLRDITERKAAEDAVRFQASLLDAVGQAVAARDVDGRVIYWNDAATRLFGWTAAEALGQVLRDLIVPVPEHDEQATTANVEHTAGRPWSGEITVTGKTDVPIPILVTGSPIHDDAGRLIGTIAVSTDMTEALLQRQRAEEDHRRMVDAQASAHLGSFELDLETGEVVGSDELWRILGRPPGPLLDMPHVHPDDREHLVAALREAAEGRSDAACTHRVVRLDGTVRWVISRSSQFHTAGSRILFGTVLDITERHEAEQALLHQATHDALTGLANRRLFVARLDELLLDAGETGEATAVLFIDLDDFRTINDRVGHVDADEVLRRLGRRIAEVVPTGGTAGRLGGDEFVVCFPGSSHPDDVLAIARQVQAAVGAPIVVGGRRLVVDSSIGIAISGHERRGESLLRNADVAMYAAKQTGRGRCELFDDALHERNRRRGELVLELRSALDTDQLATYFQPEFDLATGALFGFEALARWIHPERGVIGPDEFIPLAEDVGLIGSIGTQMLRNACRALAGWRAERPDLTLALGVNISPLQLADPRFPDEVEATIAEHGVPPSSLCLEVTESTLMDVDTASEALRRLSGLGVQVAIDDFGTGYSSFARLKRFPVDFLKLDQSFVFDIGVSDEDDVIVASMAGLAHSLGVSVIAEGIETDDQRAFLADLGCAYGQGYLWSRPVEEGAATDLVRSQPRA